MEKKIFVYVYTHTNPVFAEEKKSILKAYSNNLRSASHCKA